MQKIREIAFNDCGRDNIRWDIKVYVVKNIARNTRSFPAERVAFVR